MMKLLKDTPISEAWIAFGREQAGEEIAQLREEKAQALEEAKRAHQQTLQTMQQTIISIVAVRFPGLELLAQAVTSVITNISQLQALLLGLSTAANQEQAREL